MTHSQKRTLTQRIVSLFMCFVLVASLFVTAFAENTDTTDTGSASYNTEEQLESNDDANAPAVTSDGAEDAASSADDGYSSFLLVGAITIGAMIAMYVFVEVYTKKKSGKPVKKIKK